MTKLVNTLIGISFLFVFYLLIFSGCNTNTEPPKTIIDTETALNGSLVCKKIKRTQYQYNGSVNGASVPIEIKLQIIFNKTGHYRFETWQEQYRSNDILGETFEIDVNTAPQKMVFELKKDFYRLQIIHVKDNFLKTDSCTLGSMWIGYPDVLPEDKNYNY